MKDYYKGHLPPQNNVKKRKTNKQMSRSRYFEEEDDPYSNPSLFEALLVVNNIKKGTEVFPKCKIEDSNLIDSSLTYDSCEEDVVDETQLLDRSDYSAFRQEISESLDRPKNRFLKKNR